MNLKKTLFAALLLAVPVAVAVWFVQARPTQAASDLPTAQAREGEFLVITTSRGELVAGKSVMVTAPLNVPELRILWQAPAGSAVKAGDVILKFDTSSAQRQFQEKEANLKQSEAQLAESVAQARIAAEQSALEIAGQTTQAERARLEVTRSEILSALQAEEKKIDYGIAQEKLRVKQAEAALVKAQNESKIAVVRTTLDKVKAELELTRKRIGQMEVLAPSAGVVNYLMNYSQGWVNAKPFKVGDTVWAGSSIAEIPDLSTLQLKGKIEEIERGRLVPGLPVRMLLDPFPEKPFTGKLAGITPLAEQNFEWPPSRNFRAYAAFDQVDNRLRPGMNGRLDIIVDRIPKAISVPAKAIFARSGRPSVLVLGPKGLSSVSVEVLARNPDEVAIKGITGGTRVALVDESLKQQKGKSK
jgi:multidrug efflux pump subunit AcrA (membrane-fusion protein)